MLIFENLKVDGKLHCICSEKKRTWKTFIKKSTSFTEGTIKPKLHVMFLRDTQFELSNKTVIMGDYKQAIQFRFTRSLFLLITTIQFVIIMLAIYNGAYPRAIQTSILTGTFVITSLLLFRYNKLDWFMNMVLTFLLFQTMLTAIAMHIGRSFNYNFIFYGALGYFYNYLDNKPKTGFFWLGTNVLIFAFAGANSYYHWVGSELTDLRLVNVLQIASVVIGLIYFIFILYFYMQYFEVQRSQITETQSEVDFIRNFQQVVANFTKTPIAVLDGNDQSIIFTNESFSNDLGYQSEEFIGKPITDFQPEGTKVFVDKEREINVPFITKEGNAITRDTERNPFMINDKSYQAVFYYDSALRKEEENRLRNLIDNLPVSVTQVSKTGEVIYTNQFLEEITGFKVEEIPDVRSFLNLVIPNEDEQKVIVGEHKKLHQLATENENQTIGGQFTMKDAYGQKRYIYSTIVIFEDYDMFILNDITEERTRQERLEQIISKRTKDLRDSEQKLRAVLNSIPDLISYKSIDGTYLECNEAFAKSVNKTVDYIIGKKGEDVFRMSDVAAIVTQRDNEVIQTKEKLITDFSGEINGEQKYLSTIRTPFYDSTNELVGVVNIGRDVTELQRAVEKERELNKMKSQFITMASHQFKTPLTAILASTELLNMYKDLVPDKISSKIDRQANRISTETKRLNSLMNDVLILGKVESQKATIKKEETDLIRWAKELIENQFSNQKDGRTIEMSYLGTPQEVIIDNQMLSHVLSNLFSNALKYSEGKPSPQFTISYFTDKVIFKVKDFGIGIPEKAKEKLFQPFFRANNVGAIQGTGIGLVVIKEFVTIHGGKVTVDSVEHQGTTFTVELPIGK